MCFWSCVARQNTDSEKIYRVHLPRREREWIVFENMKWMSSRRKKASKEEDKRSSSLQWTRWKTCMAWVKLHALRRNQGSLHARILGNASEIMRSVAIWSSLKRKACNFTKHDHMQSFSTTHYLQLPLKTQDELYQKVRLTPIVPRVVL